jgi:hypothetical protein
MKFFVCLFLSIIYIAVLGQTDTAFKPFSQIISGSSYNYKLQPINGGSFKMGSPATEKGHVKTEGPQKMITVSPFWIGVYEVTHDQFGVFYRIVKLVSCRSSATFSVLYIFSGFFSASFSK